MVGDRGSSHCSLRTGGFTLVLTGPSSTWAHSRLAMVDIGRWNDGQGIIVKFVLLYRWLRGKLLVHFTPLVLFEVYEVVYFVH